MTQRASGDGCLGEFRRLAREVVLCLGGIFAVHEVEDEVVWQAARSLDRVFERSRARLLSLDGGSDAEAQRRAPQPHPAIQELLTHIDANGGD